MSTTEPAKGEEDHEPEGQSLYADEEGEESNPDPNEFDERPAECTPFGPTPYFELVSDLFEKLQDMRGKRTAKGAKGSAEKKRALVQHMFNVRRVEPLCLQAIIKLIEHSVLTAMALRRGKGLVSSSKATATRKR